MHLWGAMVPIESWVDFGRAVGPIFSTIYYYFPLVIGHSKLPRSLIAVRFYSVFEWKEGNKIHRTSASPTEQTSRKNLRTRIALSLSG